MGWRILKYLSTVKAVNAASDIKNGSEAMIIKKRWVKQSAFANASVIQM
jgi:hypothetical protein